MKLLVALVALLPSIIAAQAAGGISSFTPSSDDPSLQFAINRVKDQLKFNGEGYEYNVITAQRQVVAGMKYYFTFEAALLGKASYVCNVQVWSKPDQTREIVGTPECTENVKENSGGLLGAPTEVDFNDAEVQEAYKALENRVNLMCLCITYRKGNTAEKVTKQVVNGIRYSFTNVKFYNTECKKGSLPSSPNSMCQIQENSAPVSVCSGDVIISPGQNGQKSVENIACSQEAQEDQGKLPPPPAEEIVGGPVSYYPASNDAKVLFAVGAINDMYQRKLGSNALTYELGAVKSATRQVVSGIKYQFSLVVKANQENKLCEVNLLDRPWLEENQLRVLEEPTCVPAPLEAESGGLLGGVETVDLTDPQVKAAFDFLQERVNSMSNNLLYIQGGAPRKATKQIVAGVKYTFTDVPFYATACQKTEITEGSNKICSITNANRAETVCSGEVIKAPGPNGKYSVENLVCSVAAEAEASQGLVGAPQEASLSDKDVQEAFQALKDRVNLMSNNLVFLKGQEPKSVTKQIVAGVKYVFTEVPFLPTECMKSEETTEANCAVKNGEPVSTCSGEVYRPLGQNAKLSVSNVECH